MDKNEILELLDEFKSMVISRATGTMIPYEDYKKLRAKILEINELKGHIPAFIKSNRDPESLFRYMQGVSETYRGRREYISEEMRKVTEHVEFGLIEDPFIGLTEYSNCESLGRGGYGIVLKYHNSWINMDFAVKIFNPIFADEDAQKEGEKRFFREAKMLFNLTHKNIVRIYDVGKIDNKPFIKMEYINGMTLLELHDKYGNFSFDKAGVATCHILTGLQYAHDMNIIHRDLKPSNIMVEMAQTGWICKIIDFGISSFINTSGLTKLTKTGEFICGGQFADPQLAVNPTIRDVRLDIYSTGAILYYLLCGRAPVGGDAEFFLRRENNELTEEQISIIMKSLSIDFDRRYSSCKEMKKSIMEAM